MGTRDAAALVGAVASRAAGLALLAMVALGAQAAGATSITGVEDLRTLTANAGNSLQGQSDSESASPSTPFQDWTATVDAAVPGKSAYASQSSSVGADTLSGQGSASGSASSPLGGASAGSSYRIRFTVDAPVGFTLAGQLTGSPFVMGGGGSGNASARLVAPDASYVFDLVTPFSLSGTPALTLAQRGLLGAGTYELLVAASGSAGAGLTGGGGFGSGAFQFTFTVVPAPEPGAAPLLVLGAVALGSRGLVGSPRRPGS